MQFTILSTFVAIVAVVVSLVYLYLRYVFTYWKRRGVPYITPTIPWGNMEGLIRGNSNFGVIPAELYKEIKGPYAGVYVSLKPAVLIKDPDLVKKVLIKEFASFPDRDIYFDEEADPLSATMFALRGHQWKVLRSKLSPVFTSGKMKMMFHTIQAVGNELEQVLESICDNKTPVDVKGIFSRFTIDIIGSCVFGIECNSLKNPKTDFKRLGDKFLRTTLSNQTAVILNFICPFLLKFIKYKPTDKECADFFLKLLEDNIKYREENDFHRKDFMDLMIRLKNNENITDEVLIVDAKFKKEGSNEGITFMQLASAAFVFFIAGYETSSTTSAVALVELANNMEIQEKLRKEINEVIAKHDNKLTYEAVMDMKYLDKVVDETLRKYPIAPNLIRSTEKNCKLTDDLEIEKGTLVWISTLGIHKDPKYYPDPEKFDPERFSDEEKAKRHSMTYLPFGEGPRLCIGNRFALLQTKMAIIALIRNYVFHPTENTKITWSKKGILLFPQDDILLKPVKVSN